MLYKFYVWSSLRRKYVGVLGLVTKEQISEYIRLCPFAKYFSLPFGISRDSKGNQMDKCSSAVFGRASLVSLGAKREGRGIKTQTL